MDEERWQKLKSATWFLKEQEEVTAYVEELRGLFIRAVDLLDHNDGLVECPECGKKESVRAIEEITEHLGGPEDFHVFDFDYTFEAPVYTCPCGFAWTGREHEEASTEARRLEVEKRFREMVLENRRREAATMESVNRIRKYCADGMGLQIDQVGGMEGAIVALAVEASFQRGAHDNVRKHYEELGRQYGELLKETDGLRRFKEHVDEALNSGDGTYRP